MAGLTKELLRNLNSENYTMINSWLNLKKSTFILNLNRRIVTNHWWYQRKPKYLQKCWKKFNNLLNYLSLTGQKEHFTEALLVNNNPDSLLFTPRLYTAEKWSAHLTLENFSSLPAYHTRTLLLSSPVSCADFESDSYEWVIEFSPKGLLKSFRCKIKRYSLVCLYCFE